MRIRWTVPAAADPENIKDYLEQHQPHLAQPTTLRIYESIRSLTTSPHRGRSGRRRGTRELVLTPLPYIVVDRVKDEKVEILHIYHAAQERF